MTDRHIDFSQLILKEQFPSIHGFQSTLLLANKPAPVTNKANYLQIMHCRNNLWITVSTIGCTTTNTVHVYDSLYFSVDNVTMNLLRILFGDNVNVRLETCPKQSGVDDCGVFVIAVCVGLATTGQLPQSFTQEKMRSHMLKCLNN